MSYDLFLHRKDTSSKPFGKEEIETKLAEVFEYVSMHTNNGITTGFSVGYKSRSDSTGFSIQDDEGQLGTYCSNAVDEQTFIEFKKVVKTVAEHLDLQIEDPQMSKDLVDHAKFNPVDPESSKIFNLGKGAIQHVLAKSDVLKKHLHWE